MESIQNIDQRKIKSVPTYIIGTDEYLTVDYMIENDDDDVKTHWNPPSASTYLSLRTRSLSSHVRPRTINRQSKNTHQSPMMRCQDALISIFFYQTARERITCSTLSVHIYIFRDDDDTREYV